MTVARACESLTSTFRSRHSFNVEGNKRPTIASQHTFFAGQVGASAATISNGGGVCCRRNQHDIALCMISYRPCGHRSCDIIHRERHRSHENCDIISKGSGCTLWSAGACAAQTTVPRPDAPTTRDRTAAHPPPHTAPKQAAWTSQLRYHAQGKKSQPRKLRYQRAQK